MNRLSAILVVLTATGALAKPKPESKVVGPMTPALARAVEANGAVLSQLALTLRVCEKAEEAQKPAQPSMPLTGDLYNQWQEAHRKYAESVTQQCHTQRGIKAQRDNAYTDAVEALVAIRPLTACELQFLSAAGIQNGAYLSRHVGLNLDTSTVNLAKAANESLEDADLLDAKALPENTKFSQMGCARTPDVAVWEKQYRDWSVAKDAPAPATK
jgi:hypothetical protein